jgi:RNA recognition motif-containing protein
VNDGNEGKTELFVSGIGYNTTDDSLRAFFEEHGELVKCKLLSNKGKAFIEYADNATARAALEATNGQTLDGSTLQIEFSGQIGGAAARNSGEVNTIFVGNLSFKTDRNSLERHF